MSVDPLAIGLPSAEEIDVFGKGVGGKYRDLLSRLELIHDGEAVVTAWPHLAVDGKDTPTEQLDTVRLLALLCRPDASLAEELTERLSQCEKYGHGTGQVDPKVRWMSNEVRHREFLAVLASEQYHSLVDGWPSEEAISAASHTMSSAPGFSWTCSVSVMAFNDVWTSVLFFLDPEELPEYAFPVFRGFSRREGGWRSAARVLMEGEAAVGTDLEDGFDEAYGDIPLLLASTECDQNHDHMETVFEMTDDQLWALEQGADSREILQVLWMIRELSSSFDENGSGVQAFLEAIGGEKTLKDMRKFARRVRTVRPDDEEWEPWLEDLGFLELLDSWAK